MSIRSRILQALCLALLAIAVAGPSAAHAAQDPDALVPQSMLVDDLDKPPPGFVVTPRQARRTVARLDRVREARADHPGARVYVQLPMWGGYNGTYAVTYIDSAGDGTIVADVYVDGLTGRVTQLWTGPQAGTGKPLASRRRQSKWPSRG